MKLKEKGKYRIQLFSTFDDNRYVCTKLNIVRNTLGIYSINTNFFITNPATEEGIPVPIEECNYYQTNIPANKIDHYIATVAYTLVHEHLPAQADITNILIRFDKAILSSNSIEELIENLKSDGFQSDTVYLITKEVDTLGRTYYVHNDLKEPKFTTGNSIADRIMNEVYTELNEKLKTLKKETPTEEEKEYIIKYVGGENETN